MSDFLCMLGILAIGLACLCWVCGVTLDDLFGGVPDDDEGGN